MSKPRSPQTRLGSPQEAPRTKAKPEAPEPAPSPVPDEAAATPRPGHSAEEMRAQPHEPATLSPADRAALLQAVFGTRTPPPGPRAGYSVAATVALVALVWIGASHLPARPPQAPTPPKKKEYLVDLNPPTPPVEAPKPAPPPEAPPVEKTAPVALPKAPATPAPPQAVPSPTPPPPAQAGQIIAAEPDPSAPVDLTDSAFITGDSANYAGGTTASNGTNDKAVYTPTVDPNAKPGGQVIAAPPPPKKNKIDRSRSVQLDEDNWGCAWPREADAEQIDEQSVVLRVRVNPRGGVESVTLENDPGHGFGAAAVACAKKTRFSPALDPEGHPIAALSPPIRVRFTR